MQVAALLTASLLVSLGLTKFLSSPRARLKIIDTPNERSLHALAMPRTGGVAILAGVLFAIATLLVVTSAGFTTGLVRSAALDIRHRDVLIALVAAACLAAVPL